MAGQVAQQKNRGDAETVILQLRRLVTHGPRDLDIAFALSGYGYDAVKWAEGESVLAELVSRERPKDTHLLTAIHWCDEVAIAARHALDASPQLLRKLGVSAA